MMTLQNRSIGRRIGTHLALIFIGALFLLGGCATVKTVKNATMDMVDGIISKGDRVKRRIALVPFQNRTPWDENQSHTLFTAQLIEVLGKKCPQIILVRPGDPDFPEILRRFFSPDSGPFDNIGLAKTCREAGFNGVIAGQLTHISSEEIKRGVIGFRKTIRVARIKLDATMYHSGTAAKLMDESFSFEVEMVVAESDPSGRKWVINDKAINEPLAESVKTAANMVCEKAGAVPWEGTILSMDGDKAVIPFGESVGLRLGDKLEVYGGGNMVSAAGGYRYIIPGVKIGEMKVSAVSLRNAEAAAVEGNAAIKVGGIVRLKK